jgi:serine/threonine protein kinase
MILYELLTGRPPFVGATARETMAQVASEDPVPPSRLNPQVTPPLEAFCLRCLLRNPWHRYSRAYDLATRLRSFRADLEGRVGPGERRPGRWPPGRRDRPGGQG